MCQEGAQSVWAPEDIVVQSQLAGHWCSHRCDVVDSGFYAVLHDTYDWVATIRESSAGLVVHKDFDLPSIYEEHTIADVTLSHDILSSSNHTRPQLS